ncbi:MAG TPA: BatD family protein [Verrucomicrobiae bacterium]|nr:BatD family protein [Verrucomicrobiae bacterium]
MERLRWNSFLRWRDRKVNFLPVAAGLCLLLLWLAPASARAASFTASLDNDTLTLGQSATLSLTFEGGQPKNVPTPGVPGLQFSQAGTSQNVSWVNGAMSSTVTVAFSVTPQRAGDFAIPAMSVDVDGQTLTSQPLSLKVVQPGAASPAQIDSGSQMAFTKVTLPEGKVYAGEVVTANLQIYLRDDVRNFANFQFTAMPADGFTVGKMSEGQAQRAQIGSRVYTVMPVTIALTATRTGTLSLGPLTANLVLLIVSPNQPNDPFRQFGMRDPFGNFNEDQKQVSLATETVNVQSLPTPTENVPPNFNGAIGEYTMAVTAGPTNVAVGDPITVRIQISGRGDLGALTLPEQPAWHDFTVYPPTANVASTDPLGLQGTKTFEEIVAPQNADVRELPPFSFSYFDPDAGSYRTLTEPAVALAVRSAGPAPVPTLAGNQAASAENPARPADLLPIKDELGALAQIPAGRDSVEPLIAKPVFLAMQALPVLAWLATLVWRKRTDNLANNPRRRRQRQVTQLVAGGLNDLNQFATENKTEDFFAMLFRLLQEQLGERLDCPATAITEADVDRRLIQLGATPATLESLRELFQLCNQARYAPVQTRQELAAIAAKFKKVVGELQGLKI